MDTKNNDEGTTLDFTGFVQAYCAAMDKGGTSYTADDIDSSWLAYQRDPAGHFVSGQKKRQAATPTATSTKPAESGLSEMHLYGGARHLFDASATSGVAGAGDVRTMPPLPAQHEELRARWKCEDCDGRGHDGDLHGGDYFQPPEPGRCSTCDGAGCMETEAYTAEQMREYAEAYAAAQLDWLREEAADLRAQLARQQAPIGDSDLSKQLREALQKAFALGQTYWAQADSEYVSQHKKSEETARKYHAFVDETCAHITAWKDAQLARERQKQVESGAAYMVDARLIAKHYAATTLLKDQNDWPGSVILHFSDNSHAEFAYEVLSTAMTAGLAASVGLRTTPAPQADEVRDTERLNWLAEAYRTEHPHAPYYDDGCWRCPYLVHGSPLGGGVGEATFTTLREAIDWARTTAADNQKGDA